MSSVTNGAGKQNNGSGNGQRITPASPRPLSQAAAAVAVAAAAHLPSNPFSKPLNPFDDDTPHSPDPTFPPHPHPTYSSHSHSPHIPTSASVSPTLSTSTPSPPTSRPHTPDGILQPIGGVRDSSGSGSGDGSRTQSTDDASMSSAAHHSSLNPFEEEDEDEYASSEGTDGPDDEDEEAEAEGEEAEDDEQQVEVEAALSSLSPLSSLLSSLNSSNHSTNSCDLSGVWEVNQAKSNSLQPLLTTTGVSPALASSIDAASSVVVSTVHHDPQQHTLTIVDESVRGRSISTFYTDGVVRNVVVSGHTSLRRAYEEEEEVQQPGSSSSSSSEVMELKRHRLRGGVVRVETQMSNAMEMEDVRVLVDRTVMLQRTILTRAGNVLVECNRWYDKKESDEERARGEKEWKDKLEVAELLQRAKQLKRDATEARRQREEAQGEDEAETAGNEDEQGSEDGEGSVDEEEENDDDSAHSSTSASPEATPSNSPYPITLPPPPPPPDFTASFNGTWSVLRNYSQDVTPLLKKMHVSWMDRSMTTQQETVTMNVGRSIVVCVDRSSLGSAELRYQCDGLWHDGMGFGGKEGKVRVAVERKHPFSLTIETSWLKDKRSKFQQLIEPGAEKAAGWQPGIGGRAGGRGGVPLGFVVCKLIDVRVLERRAIIKQMLQYAENGAVRLVCVRYMRKLESKMEKMRGEEQERARLLYERMVEQQRQAAAAQSSTAKLKKQKRNKKATSASSSAASSTTTHRTQQQSTAERIEQIIQQQSSAADDSTTPTSATRSSGAASPSRRYTAGYRRMSISSTSPTHPAAVSLAPNPLLSFLPVRLLVEGGRVGQVYGLLCVGLLAAVCAGSVWVSGWLVLTAAFYLHYHEVVQRSRRVKEAAVGAAGLVHGVDRSEESRASVDGRDKSGGYDGAAWDDGSSDGQQRLQQSYAAVDDDEKLSETGVT